MNITIIVPLYNEEASLPFLFDRLITFINDMPAYTFEIIFVNDGSTDNSLQLIKQYQKEHENIFYIDLSRNFGKEIAMLAGLDYATGDCVIFMDADLQDPPELIPEMIAWWEKGYDDVYAQRSKREGESFLKKFTSKLYYQILQKFTPIPIQKDTGDFRLLDRKCVDAICSIRESTRCTKSIFSWVGYQKKAILFNRESRVAGKTKWNYRKLVNLAINGFTSLSTAPLRWAFYVSGFMFFMFFAYLIYLMITYIASPVIQVYQLVLLCLFLFFTIQTFLIGVMSEYLGKIFMESKNRPLYLIRESNMKKNIKKER